jgi:hypothetical protein
MLRGFRDCVERTVLRVEPADNGFEHVQLHLVYVSAFRCHWREEGTN